MIEEIYNNLVNYGLKGATMELTMYPNKDYVIIPFARDIHKKWFGAQALNYKVTGNFSNEGTNEFVLNVLKCFKVCYDYENQNISLAKKSVDPNFEKEVKKNGIKGFHCFSISLNTAKEVIAICKLRFVDKNGKETIGKEEDTTVIKLSEFNKIYQIIEQKMNISNR